jgi:hypothetical protein
MPPRLCRPALVSFLLGLLALPLLIVAGLPALLLGYHSLYAINASEGRLRGRRLAVAGMALGALGSLVGVGYLVLLLMGRLQQANARTDCANNLRQIGQAVWLYHDQHNNTFPQAVVSTPPGLPPEERLSWLAALLPYLERKAMPQARWDALVASLDPAKSWEAPANKRARTTNVTTFLCRAHPSRELRSVPGLTHYVGLAGVGVRAATFAADNPDAGFFGYDRPLTDERLAIDPDRQKRLAGATSYLVIAAETTRDNGPWVAGGPPTVRGIYPDVPPFGVGAPFGGCHPGGCDTLWLDGSARFLADSLPADLFAEMARINKQGEAKPPD